MPFKSKAQRRFMYAKHPEMAKRWEEHTPDDAKLPEKVKKASEVLRTLAPFSQGYRDLRGLVEPHPITDPSPADQAIAYVQAKQELDRTDAEEAKPSRRRLIENLLHGAALGGGLGYAKGWIASQSPTSASALGTGLGMAALGAGVSGAFTLARDKLREKLRSRSRKTLLETPQAIRHVAELPKTKDAVENYSTASWYPYYGAEAGGLLGGFGTLAAQYALGNKENNFPKFMIGAGVGGTAGLLLGLYLRNKQRKKMLSRIRRVVKPKVLEQTGLMQDTIPMEKAALARNSGNGWMLPALGKPERYTGGRRKIAEQVFNTLKAKLAMAPVPGIQPTPAQAFVASKTQNMQQPAAQPAPAPAPAPAAQPAGPVNITGGTMNTSGRGGAAAPTLPQGPKLAMAIGIVSGYMAKKALELNIEKGDTLLGGRFKNIPMKVEEIGTDELGQPTVNGKKLLAFRIQKEMPKKAEEVMVGGKADGMSDKEFDPEQLANGVEDEKKEHGDTPAAKEVAKDHLAEDSEYYKKAAALPKLRSRAEVIVYSQDGILAIKKDDYLLLPGGGIDDGETAEQAVCREALEEADRKLLNLTKHEAIDTLHTKPIMEGFDGERSIFFIAADGGECGTKHDDRESFTFMPFSDAKSFLRELIDNPKQAWAADNNRSRLAAVEKAESIKDEPIRKLADVPTFLDKPESLAFTPEGKLLVKRLQNRRLELPGMLPGTRPAPYEDTVRFIPEGGVPEAGFHGYNIGLRVGEVADPVEGFEATDPQDALKEMYASMGLATNRPYREVDRARARAILRYLKKKRQQQVMTAPAAEPVATANPVLQ